MKIETIPRVIFPQDFDERLKFEMSAKGWLSAQVELQGGSRYPVYFSDPVRLQQDLEAETELGRPYFAEPGLIVLPEVTLEAIQDAVQALGEQGFFDHLRAHPANGSAVVSENGS